MEDNMFGFFFEESASKPAKNPALLSFDMWCQCSAKNVRRIIKRNQVWKPLRVYLLKLVLQFCRLADVEPFVYGGTALAVYRENGKMIQHDSDIDLAVIELDKNGIGAFTKLIRKCIEMGVSYSGVSGEFPPFNTTHGESELTMSFDSRRTGKSWLRGNGPDMGSICEQLYDGKDCKIAKFYLTEFGLRKACNIFGKSSHTFNQLMTDSCFIHIDLFTLSPHPQFPSSHLQVNWNIPGVYDALKKAFPISSILPLKDYTFEDVPVRGPAELESYLTVEYGYLGRDAMFDSGKQAYVKIPDELRSFLPKHMLDPSACENSVEANKDVCK